MSPIRARLIWAALVIVIAAPLVAAAFSPLHAWRDPIYITAGFAGIVAMVILLVQPLLAGGYLPGLAAPRGRRIHRIAGFLLVAAIVAHVAGLWITSPPDMVDALLFASPTPFSAWGVVAMWAIFGTALLAAFRRRLRLITWRRAHMAFAAIIVPASVVHAMLIEGAMETITKAVLCALVLAAGLKAILDLRTVIRRMASR